MKSLKQQTIKGMSWSMIDNLVSSGTTFLIGLILARLLSPEEFGIIGVITVFLAIAMLLIDSGFTQALIRKKDIDGNDYNTAFWFNVLVSIVCYCLVFLTSNLIADFFKQEELEGLLKIAAFVLISNALSIIQRTIFIRSIDFKSIAITTITSAIISGGVGLVLAFMDFGVWSLVAQIVSRSVVQTITFWSLSKWRPKLLFRWNNFKEMFDFGYKLLLSGLIDVLYKNIFYVIIGKYYSTKVLGEYTRANQFSTIFSSNLLAVIQKVSFPVLSSIQDDEHRLKEGYRKLIKSSMLVTFTMMFGLAAIAKPLIVILIGEKWLPAVYFLQILCLSEMLYPLHAINLNVLNVKGRSDLFLKLEIYKKSLSIPVILIGVSISVDAMLWCGVFTSFVAYFINSYYTAQLINYSMKSQLEDILPSFLISLIVGVAIWSITLLNINLYLTLVIQMWVGIVIAILIYERLNLSEYIEVKNIAVALLGKIIKKRINE